MSVSSSSVKSQSAKHTADTQRPYSPTKLPSAKHAAESNTVKIVNKDGTVLDINDMTAVDPGLPSPFVRVLLRADRLDLSAVIVAGLELRDANPEIFFCAITGSNSVLANSLLDAYTQWKTARAMK
jgi:hypothetical protein